MEEIRLSKKQAEEFAWSIFAEIEAYVNEHAEEYQEFLRNEK